MGATGATGGVLRVSAPVALAQLHLTAPLATFLRKNPGVRIELLLNDRIADLVEERIDLAVRVTKLEDSSLVARRLAYTPLHICASPRYLKERGRPTKPEDLLRHDCLRYSLMRAEHEWRLYGKNGRIRLDLNGSLETTSGLMLREAAIAGLGLAILPRFMISDALEAGLLETVLDEYAPRPIGIYAVRSGRRTAPRLVTELVRTLEAAFRTPKW
jgi:DNA-binding transcriptional LysR family regulator